MGRDSAGGNLLRTLIGMMLIFFFMFVIAFTVSNVL